jgi:hypothetical protein
MIHIIGYSHNTSTNLGSINSRTVDASKHLYSQTRTISHASVPRIQSDEARVKYLFVPLKTDRPPPNPLSVA